jgi:predicted MFS family arabinose efflux permease
MLLAAVLLAVLPRRLAVPAATLAGLAQVLTSPPLAVSVLFFATYLIGAWSAYAFIGPLIELKLGAGRDLVAALLAVYGLGAFVGSLVGGRVSDRLGHDRTLLAITIAAIPLVGLVTVVPWTVPTAAILLFVWAMVSWSAAVPQQARIIALAPDKAQVLLALNAACIYLGASGGASIAAATKASVGLVWTGPAGAVVGTLALAHLLLAMRLTRAT